MPAKTWRLESLELLIIRGPPVSPAQGPLPFPSKIRVKSVYDIGFYAFSPSLQKILSSRPAHSMFFVIFPSWKSGVLQSSLLSILTSAICKVSAGVPDSEVAP